MLTLVLVAAGFRQEHPRSEPEFELTYPQLMEQFTLVFPAARISGRIALGEPVQVWPTALPIIRLPFSLAMIELFNNLDDPAT